MKNSLIITIIVALVVGAGGFFAGMKYQQSQRSAFAGQFAAGQGFARGGTGARGNGANRPVNGTILSSDNNSLTVKLSDGSSKLVLLTASTQINKAATATVSDLTTGQTVAVFGTTNSDGSVTAQSVQLNPTMRLGNNQPSPSPAQ